VRFTHHAPGEGTFLDHHGGEILGITVNGAKAEGLLAGYRICLPSELLRRRNEIVIEYRNPFDRTGVGFHRFVDPEDSEVYLFTDFEPFSAHRLFPCFDQPDLKATYAIDVTAPKAWT